MLAVVHDRVAHVLLFHLRREIRNDEIVESHKKIFFDGINVERDQINLL